MAHLDTHLRHHFPSWRLRFTCLLALLLVGGCSSQSESSKPIDAVLPTQERNPEPSQTRQQQLQAATQLIEAGEIEQASRAIRDLLIATPNDAAVNTLMMRVMIHRGDIPGAVDILDRMAQTYPDRRDDMEAHAANLLYESGEVEAAITRFQTLLERRPDFDDARRRLAQILNLRGYGFDANEQIRTLIGRTLMSRDELVSLVFPSRAWVPTQVIESLKSEQQRRSLSIMAVANAYRIEGNPRKALQYLRESDVVANRHPAAIALLGRTLADAQQYRDLQQWIREAPVECERYPDFWIASGALASHNKNAVAVACFIEAIKREPNSLDAHYGLIESLEAAGDKVLAEKFRERASMLDTVNRDVKKIHESPSVTAQALIDVAKQLLILGRPIEALAWQELASSQDFNSGEKLRVIQSRKRQVLSEMPTGRDESAILCGMDGAKFTSAQTWLADQRKGTPQRLADNSFPRTGMQQAELPLINPVFQNIAGQVGLAFRYKNAPTPIDREFQIFQAFGGGAACLDYDRDGLVDFYFGQAAATPPDGVASEPNALFRNLGSRVVDVTDQAGADDRGYTVGVTAGDWNQDGFADLLVSSLGPNQLLINQGDGTFRLHDDDLLRSKPTYTSSVAIADVTGDALPDIIEINYLDDPSIFEPIAYRADGKPVSLPGPLQFHPAMDRLFVSRGDGSMSAGPLGNQDESEFSTGLALLVTDLDAEPGNEVFVANDLKANQLWVRRDSDDARPAWNDVAVASGVAYGSAGKPMACMGIAAADFDGNGRLDLHVTNFEDEWSNQYMQQESGSFVDSAVPFKLDVVSRKMLGFGTQAIDYDNNTRWDLIVGNGHIEDLTDRGKLFAMPTQLLVGRRDGFLEQPVSGDDEYWNGMHFSRAMAKCDWNRDGRVDVVVSDLKTDAVLLENQTMTANHWLQVELVGTRSERDAIGAVVTAEFGSTSLVQPVQTGDGYLSKNESALFFGLGPTQSVRRLHVRWPTGGEQTFENLAADSRVLVVEGRSNLWIFSDQH